MNAIMTIMAYRHNSGWAFDDAENGLKAEPFVSGIPEMIDVIVGDSEKALLVFSSAEFPGCTMRLDWLRSEFGGNWYRWEARNMDGWLCPALFAYFSAAPASIYLCVEGR